MGRQVDWTDVPDSNILPEGLYVCEIESIEEKQSRSGKLMYHGTFRVADGVMKGSPLFEYFVIGSDDDPNADQPQTWKAAIGSRRLKAVFRAAQVPDDRDIDNRIAVAVGQRLIAAVQQETDQKKTNADGSPNSFFGNIRNKIGAFYSTAERAAGPTAPAAAPAASDPSAGNKSKPLAKPVSEDVECPYCPSGKNKVNRKEYMGHLKSEHPEVE